MLLSQLEYQRRVCVSLFIYPRSPRNATPSKVEEIKDALNRAREAGIKNILALRGDPAKGKVPVNFQHFSRACITTSSYSTLTEVSTRDGVFFFAGGRGEGFR